jgi:membrane-bound serine protease (ClpP class)
MNYRHPYDALLRAFLAITFLIVSALITNPVLAQENGQHVAIIEIKTEVDLGMLSYVDHAMDEAEKNHDIVVLDVNTFGGRLDVATKIRDRILNASVPLTVAFIDSRAISAGALISLAAKKIIMAPGSTIGAATPIYESGEKASEKVVSYMRAEMRSTAERNHRNPTVAEAMVDESLGVDSTNGYFLPKGKLATLTTDDAIRLGIADTTAKTLDEALAELGFKSPTLTKYHESVGDEFIRFLTNGLVSGILIMLGLAGLFYTIKTGHFGGITIVAVLALVLFFGAEYLTSIAPIIAIVVFLAGIALLIVEVSPIPSFGFAGVLGIAGVGLGLYLALAGDLRTLTPERNAQVFTTLAIALVGFMVGCYLIIKYAPKSQWVKKFSNQAESAEIASYHAEQALMIGKRGTAITLLRPAGLALIEDKKTDVVTRGEFIHAGTPIIVIETKGNRNVVAAEVEQVPSDEIPKESPEGEPFGGRLPGNLQPRV